jgi:hypothetical protein
MRWALYIERAPAPQAISIEALSALLQQVGKVIRSFVKAKKIAVQTEPLASLVEIGCGSTCCTLSVSDEAAPAIAELEDRLADGEYHRLPLPTWEAAYELSNTLRKHSWGLSAARDSRRRCLISPDRPVGRPAPIKVRVQSIIYGTVRWLGGDRPTIEISGFDKRTYTVRATDKDVRSARIYEPIGMRVEMVLLRTEEDKGWKAEDIRLLEILPYRGTPSAQAITLLAEKFGDVWSDVSADEFMERVRGR